MVEQSGITLKRKRERSPSYPGIDLETALQRAKQLREKEGKNFAPVGAVIQHWGYSPKSSSGLVALAALKKFGLVDEQGSGDARRVRVSALAQGILLDEREGSPERLKLIRDSALTPPIHAELWQQFEGSMPSDENLRYSLRAQRGFTDSAVGEFIEQFKQTVAFARLDQAGFGYEADDHTSTDDDFEESLLSPSNVSAERMALVPTTSGPGQRAISIPVSVGEWATLHAAFPLSEVAWRQMIAVLEAMKPALVAQPDGREPATAAFESVESEEA